MSTQTTAGADAALRYVPAGRTPGGHEVDWDAAPPPYKRYPDAKRFVLPWPAQGNQMSRLLRDLYGQTGIRWAHPTNSLYQDPPAPPRVTATRLVPSGGALYPLSVYVAAGPDHEVPAGLYHYDVAHHVLDMVRAGDHRAALTDSLNGPVDDAPGLVLVVATRFWRNGFKYREFGYRLQSQETGVLAAQAFALADAMHLAATLHLRFVDERINRLIGLDPFRESALAVLTLTGPGATIPAVSPSFDELTAVPVAMAEDEPLDITEALPATAAVHTATLCERRTPDPYSVDIPLPSGQVRVMLPAQRVRLADGVIGRISPNGFATEPLSQHQVAAVLAAASQGVGSAAGTVPYCLLSRVNGITPGAYRYLPSDNALVPVGTTEALRHLLAEATQGVLTRLALHEAGMAVIPVGNYESGVWAHGNRWYRMQNVDAGVMMHRATLAATAIGLGARIFSDGTRDTVDAAIGLAETPNQSLSMLLVGHARPSPTQLDFLPRTHAGRPVETGWRPVR